MSIFKDEDSVLHYKFGTGMSATVISCKDCKYYIPYKDASGYGCCQSNHTFDGAFRGTDFCSYAKPKDTQN